MPDRGSGFLKTLRTVFGANVRLRRKRAGLTQVEVARRVGIRQGHLSNLERGLKGCGPEVAARLADVFDLHGIDRTSFELEAAETLRRRAGLHRNQTGMAAAIVSLVLEKLSGLGIDPEDVCDIRLRPLTRGLPGGGDFIVRLADREEREFTMEVLDA